MYFKLTTKEEIVEANSSWVIKVIQIFSKGNRFSFGTNFADQWDRLGDNEVYPQAGVKVKVSEEFFLLVSAITPNDNNPINYRLTVTCTDLEPVVINSNIPLDGQHLCISSTSDKNDELKYKVCSLLITKELPTVHPLQSLLVDNDDWYDFELRVKQTEGEVGGSVRVHKLVLVACSPVFKQMLSGPWKETNQGCVEIPTDLPTLEAFKKYIYTGQLPQDLDVLKNLLPFGSLYMMPELEQSCILSIVPKVNTENFYDCVVLALANNCQRLFWQLLNYVTALDVDINKIKIVSNRPTMEGCSPNVSSGNS